MHPESEVKVYKDGEMVVKGNDIIVEMNNVILKIKDGVIYYENKKIKNKVECFMVR